jgi:hypothetical protein
LARLVPRVWFAAVRALTGPVRSEDAGQEIFGRKAVEISCRKGRGDGCGEGRELGNAKRAGSAARIIISR